MSIDARMLAAVQALYDAALDETLWPAALQCLSDFTGSQAATFWTLDGSRNPRLPIFTAFNLDPKFTEEYVDSMVPHDPTVQYLVRHPHEPIIHDGLVISEREKDRHPYYDWQSRHSDLRFRMIGQSRPAPAAQAGVALHRTRKAGAYEPADLERFAFLHAHLQRALAIGFRLGSLGALQQCMETLLDRDPSAILLLDGQRRIVYANRQAEGLRTGTDGIRLSREGIALSRRQDQARLEELIDGVLSVLAHPGKSGGVMRASRPSGKRAYAILVDPAACQHPALSFVRPAVCVVISDLEAQEHLSVDRLQAAFGLTGAEAKLAALLAAGEALRPSAAKLGITYGTARARLAEIFQKTQTRRQGELVRILVVALGTR